MGSSTKTANTGVEYEGPVVYPGGGVCGQLGRREFKKSSVSAI